MTPKRASNESFFCLIQAAWLCTMLSPQFWVCCACSQNNEQAALMSPRSSSRLCADPALQSVWPSFRLKASLLCPPLNILPEPSTGCHEHSLSVALSGAAVSWHRPSAHQPAMPTHNHILPTCPVDPPPPVCRAWPLYCSSYIWPVPHCIRPAVSCTQRATPGPSSHRQPNPCGTSSSRPCSPPGSPGNHTDTPTLVAHAHLSPAPH